MAFDPTKFGATPVKKTGFNPAVFGAYPVTPAPPPPASQSFADKIWSDIANRQQDFMSAANRESLRQTTRAETILNLAGNTAGVAQDVAGRIFEATGANAALNPILDFFGNIADNGGAAVGKFLGQFASPEQKQKVIDLLSHPNTIRALQAIKSTEDLFGGAMAIEGGVRAPEQIKTGVESAKSAVTSALETRRAARAVADARAVDNLAGTIVQGKTTDIAAAKKALTSIDTTDVKSYSDLVSALDEKVANLSAKLDETLFTNKEVKKLPDLLVKSKIGESTVSHNFVADAIRDLKELYKNTNDPTALERINQFEARAAKDGLLTKEVNDLARVYGEEFRAKAFSKIGEPLTSVTAQGLENTRSGVKATAREMFNNPVFKAADADLTRLIKTRDLVEKVNENVAKLRQKVTERSFGQKVGRLAFQVIDMFSGGAVKGFVQSFVPRSAGLKIMNALDLEEGLAKNLKRLQDVLDKNLSEAQMEAKLQEIIDSAQIRESQPSNEGNSQAATRTTAIKSQEKAQTPKNSNIPSTEPEKTASVNPQLTDIWNKAVKKRK